MSQNDFVIDNGTGAQVRQDINSALQALATLSSGPSAPGTTYPYQFWADTTNGLLKQRNAANTSWVTLGPLADLLYPQINGLPVDTSPDISADYIATYKASAAANRKVPLSVIAAGPMFQCRLTLDTDSGNLVLSRYNGRFLFINGVNREIPQAGVTLPPTGLTPDTTYNIYAYMDSGTMKLEASTTPPTVAMGYGNMVKAVAGGEQYSLVGMARVVAGPAWVDTDSQRFVLSYYNRRTLPVVGASTNGQTTTSTSPVELTTNARAHFLTWGDEAVSIHLSGRSWNSNAGFSSMVQVGVDGAGVGVSTQAQSPNPNGPEPQSAGYAVLLAEGYHYITPLGWVSGNTGTFHVQVHGTIQG